jgi:hypothetical protein
LLQKFTIFLEKKSPKQCGQGSFLEIFKKKKKKSHFEEKSFEIVKIFQKIWAKTILAFFF